MSKKITRNFRFSTEKDTKIASKLIDFMTNHLDDILVFSSDTAKKRIKVAAFKEKIR